jgi:microcin C transport system substrate-binding protein
MIQGSLHIMNKVFVTILIMLLSVPAFCELPKSLPDNIVWKTNDSDPIFADPSAKPGGRYRTFMMSFPLTLRRVGPDSNGSFAGFIRANHLSLVDRHPNTLKPIPQLATHWAFGDDGKTLFFKLDKNARWSDGQALTADDYIFALEFMRSKNIVAPWYNDYYMQVVTNVVKYDDYTIGIEGSSAKPRDELLMEYSIQPVAKHFHAIDKDWVRETNWLIEPNTGPYQICEIRKGKYIDFCKVKNWWANDLKYMQYRFNVDVVRVKVIRDMNLAWQAFTLGELDSFGLILPQLWHKKAEQSQAFIKGWIERIVFYNDVPQPSQGMYLNESEPLLTDIKVRKALAHAMNIDKVIRTVLRNDYERLNTMNEGYGDYTNTSIVARAFDLNHANQLLDEAGWQQRNKEGIRTKNNQVLSLRITYSQPAHTERLVILKEEALKAGIELNLQILDGSAAFKQILEKKHQIAWMGWSGGGISPVYWEFFHSDNANKPQTNNVTNTADPMLDAKIIAYRDATEKLTRVALAHELEEMIYQRAVVIPTFKVPYTREAFWRWLKLPAFYGTRSSESLFDPFGSTGGLFWIDENEKIQVDKARKLGNSFPTAIIRDDTWRVQKTLTKPVTLATEESKP